MRNGGCVALRVLALALCGYALPLCGGLACRSCRDGQLLLEEQK